MQTSLGDLLMSVFFPVKATFFANVSTCLENSGKSNWKLQFNFHSVETKKSNSKS